MFVSIFKGMFDLKSCTSVLTSLYATSSELEFDFRAITTSMLGLESHQLSRTWTFVPKYNEVLARAVSARSLLSDC
jgi:hypothetical protein